MRREIEGFSAPLALGPSRGGGHAPCGYTDRHEQGSEAGPHRVRSECML